MRAAGRLIDHSNYSHSYPFCWRSDTPLIYKVLAADHMPKHAILCWSSSRHILLPVYYTLLLAMEETARFFVSIFITTPLRGRHEV